MGPRPRLIRYLKDYQRQSAPMVSGQNDCLTFTDGAWQAMYGHGWAGDWIGRYAADGRFLRREALIKAFGFDSFLDGIDARLTRVQGVPPFGALIAAPGRGVFGYGLGICTGHHAAMLGPDGVCRVHVEDVTAGWL